MPGIASITNAYMMDSYPRSAAIARANGVGQPAIRLPDGSVMLARRYGAAATSPSATPGRAGPAASPTSASPSVDRTMAAELRAAAATGRGITVAELDRVVERHLSDGPATGLTTTEREALRAALRSDGFATSVGADRARRLSGG